jgi:putative ABC transport system ATP-binding protein
MTANAIVVEHVSRVYDGASRVLAVDDVSFAVSPGEAVLIIGPNGSGKTTLLSMIGGLLAPSSGRIVIAGKQINEFTPARLTEFRRTHVGFIFQAFRLFDALTARENVQLVLEMAGRDDAFARAGEHLESVGMSHRAGHFARTLSGGEKQRIAIARALANDPAVVLADEPTGSLDSTAGEEATRILLDAARERSTAVIIVSHDSRIERHVDRVLRMSDGKVFASG